ncbi:hypothetical protein BDQ17DRAFT_1260357, partial [Cyathus striatus]
VWLTIVTVLAVLDIRRAKDAEGNEVTVSGDFSAIYYSHPLQFECSITPRSDVVAKLIYNF